MGNIANDQPKGSHVAIKRFWLWLGLGVLVLIIVAGGAFVFLKPHGETDKDDQSSGQEVSANVKQCIEDAVGKERAKAIHEGTAEPTADEQKVLDKCHSDNKESGKSQSKSKEDDSWQNLDFYPDTESAPTLELTWDGTFDPKKATRYVPFAVWETQEETPQGIAYQPAIEMEFHYESTEIDYLAVAPGVITDLNINEDANAKTDAGGRVAVRYGKNYAVVYYHINPDSTLKKGQKIEAGQKLGTMPSSRHQDWGDEVMWEIGLIKYDPAIGLAKVVAPYDYFSAAGKALLNDVVANSKEKGLIGTGPNAWTITDGCSWAKYVGKPEYHSDIGVLGYQPEGIKEDNGSEEFVKSMNPSWTEIEGGYVIGPTDICRK